jgi:hypothetical protein
MVETAAASTDHKLTPMNSIALPPHVYVKRRPQFYAQAVKRETAGRNRPETGN